MDPKQLLLTAFLKWHPEAVAHNLELLEPTEATEYLETLSPKFGCLIVRHMSPLSGSACLELMSLEIASQILSRMEPDLAANLCRRISGEILKPILSKLPVPKAKLLYQLLNFPGDSAGALLDPTVFVLPEDITVEEAWERFQKSPERAIYYIYVINRQQKLEGVVSIRGLALKPREAVLSTVVKKDVSTINAEADRKEILSNAGWSEHHALPVITRSEQFLGVIHYETLRRLESGADVSHPRSQLSDVGIALGELYYIGVKGIVEGLAGSFKHK